MKYIVVLADGMADYPLAELDYKTPMQVAAKPVIDCLAAKGKTGLVKTIPDGFQPGSDTANLSVMGYDPLCYYSGRSPFEAASMGVELRDSDITFRCNLVTLSEEKVYAQKKMLDHSADEISTAEARELIEAVNDQLGRGKMHFYPGVSYRHLLVWEEGPYDWELIPPHDILGQKIEPYLPQGRDSALLQELMESSVPLLSKHAVNKRRQERGLRPANSLWIWGEGRKPRMPSFYEKFKLRGAVISAVDLIRGIGIIAGLKAINVDGATGTFHTNYRGKAEAALNALKRGYDFVYIHIEAPDECGHRFEVEKKVKAIERIDAEAVRILKETLDSWGDDYKLLILPDHATPLSLRTHTADPVPFLLYNSSSPRTNPVSGFDEVSLKDSALFLAEGHKLMEFVLKA
ncbi:MAG: cofactor-independent phosphoglycerate mutase [Dethiobacteria bacterium]|nr:cofactor-independent phosphoglycerate mutase [Bacillota bacterium]